ncbi:hypothetical protein [Burkholderia ubonensis]|uniref:hypothetical protein n=1 Tax=Burkholderia ubonensis TaxID=101571 RepID=UPI0012FBAD5E|nr:hypothetical protein [Burkholderia ubonensis]
MELGKYLVSELKGHDSEDTLTVWLMHYIAELIAKAERSNSSAEVLEAKREACATILKLWEHRESLSGRANPMNDYQKALSTLHQLSENGYFIVRGLGGGGNGSIDEFRRRSKSLLGTLLVMDLPGEPLGDEHVAVRHLSKSERTLLKSLTSIRITRLMSGSQEKEQPEDPREALKRDALKDIAQLRASLDAIEARLQGGERDISGQPDSREI